MNIDWPIIISALGVLVTVVIFLAKRIHNADWDNIHALKQDSDTKIDAMNSRLDRFESDVADMRDEHRVGVTRLENRLDRMEANFGARLDRLMELMMERNAQRRASDK